MMTQNQAYIENKIIVDVGFENTPYKKRIMLDNDSQNELIGFEVKHAFEQCKRKMLEDMNKELGL